MHTPSPSSSRHSAEMNATPMLDVLLVLLVIFMLVAMRVQHVIEAQLPVPCERAECAGDVTLVLEVLPGPAYRLNGEPVARDALAAKLAAVYAGRPRKELQVAGRAGVSYQQVIDAMDAARGAGVRVIGLAPRELARSAP
jgi:biopolymer transport protein ExbD